MPLQVIQMEYSHCIRKYGSGSTINASRRLMNIQKWDVPRGAPHVRSCMTTDRDRLSGMVFHFLPVLTPRLECLQSHGVIPSPIAQWKRRWSKQGLSTWKIVMWSWQILRSMSLVEVCVFLCHCILLLIMMLSARVATFLLLSFRRRRR